MNFGCNTLPSTNKNILCRLREQRIKLVCRTNLDRAAPSEFWHLAIERPENLLWKKSFCFLQDLQVGEPERKATPEDLIHATKGVTLATAKAVAAGNSGKQEDIVQAANVGQRYCTELLIVVKVNAGRLNFS